MEQLLGCMDQVTVSISAITPPAASLGNVNPDSCYGDSNGAITINVTNGTTPYVYHWGSNTTGINTQGGFAAGIYIITVTDANNCTTTVSATINQPATLTALPTVSNVTCHGGNNGSVTLTVNGGNGSFHYQWNNTSQNTAAITGLSANTYNVTVTDMLGCHKDTFASVTEPSPLTLSFNNIVQDSCSYSAHASATVSASGSNPGYTYLWSNTQTAPTISNLLPGTYTVTVSDTNHCTAADSIHIGAPAALIITPSTTDVSCHNDSNGTASVTVSGGTPTYSYFWNVDSTTSAISQLHAGTYAVTVTDAWGCTALQSGITVVDPSALTVSATVTPQSCISQTDGALSLGIAGGNPAYSYAWAPLPSSASAINNLSSGMYYYTVTDAHGCSASDSALVPLASAMNIVPAVMQPLCPPLTDGSIALTVSGGNPTYSYQWNNNGQSSVISQLGPGTYYVTVTDSRGCNALDTFTLAYLNNLTVEAGINDTINLGESVTLTATTNSSASDISFIWSPDYHLSCISCQSTIASPAQTLTYYVNASDTNGCKAVDSVVVFVNKNYNIYVPNAFTPNGNSVNDYFQIFGDTESWKQLQVEIFNRWGEKIFESHDLDFKWDGTYKGKMQEPNVYVYVITVTFVDGHSTGVLKGSITLIR
jgi:gliding motility-associated-like protein